MNVGMINLDQNHQLNASQITRISLIAGILLYTKQVSYEEGFHGWIESLLVSYVSQPCDKWDFKNDLISFGNFIDQSLISEKSLGLKSGIREDIQMTIRAMEISLGSEVAKPVKQAA